MSTTATIVWLRRDLRLTDHAALTAAANQGPVVPVYIHAPQEEGAWPPGAASCWWLHHSLASLASALAQRGMRLTLRRGDSLDELQRLIRETGARRVYWQRCYEPWAVSRDTHIKETLRGAGVEAESFPGALLVEPWQLLNRSGQPYQVFTPFWRAALTILATMQPLPMPRRLTAPSRWPSGLPLEEFDLLPRIRWDRGLERNWQPGATVARRQLATFVSERLDDYASQRERPDLPGTSRLSAALHFGEISPRQILAAIQSRAPRWRGHKFVTELGWREFAHHLLFHFPETPEQPLRREFLQFPWRTDSTAAEALRAWQQGRTGVPIVDAGMRELWSTGYMHNRVRMIVASFLVKNLRIHWCQGARWFWDTLVDADLANNTLGWQWAAGCGADAAPYFRVFNPLLQARRFDPAGDYVRRWVPEATDAVYGAPIVDLAQSHAQALEAWRQMRRAAAG